MNFEKYIDLLTENIYLWDDIIINDKLVFKDKLDILTSRGWCVNDIDYMDIFFASIAADEVEIVNTLLSQFPHNLEPYILEGLTKAVFFSSPTTTLLLSKINKPNSRYTYEADALKIIFKYDTLEVFKCFTKEYAYDKSALIDCFEAAKFSDSTKICTYIESKIPILN